MTLPNLKLAIAGLVPDLIVQYHGELVWKNTYSTVKSTELYWLCREIALMRQLTLVLALSLATSIEEVMQAVLDGVEKIR